MKSLSPDSFLAGLREALGERLLSVVQYGSSVTGEFVAERSDHNYLVVTESLDVATLRAIRPLVAVWRKAGQQPPMLFTRERLVQSADVFPIELFDIREQHKVLHGVDVVAELDLTEGNLRWQLESELKGKLIALREGYLATSEKPVELIGFMVGTFGSFQVLMRAMLRLVGEPAPAQKTEVAARVASKFGLELTVFADLQAVKSGSVSPKSVDAEGLFGRYLSAVETLVDTVDAHIVS